MLIGENNAGKSNIVDALRLVLEPETGPRSRRWVTLEDFAHDGTGARVADHLDIEVEFSDLPPDDEARMVTCLAPSLGERIARLRMSAVLSGDGKVDVEWFGGGHPDT